MRFLHTIERDRGEHPFARLSRFRCWAASMKPTGVSPSRTPYSFLENTLSSQRKEALRCCYSTMKSTPVAQRVFTQHVVSLTACLMALLFLSGRDIFHLLLLTFRL